ncbi:hypothetical protein [uncultured Roseibium sp.]|uniref:hypothetical protein n=1 Tax=uncultured Roseibium sp. TaxID=1936171 RepID=UPI0026151696|nr:hypothetical protein [uncultured Roseibium sp.]
MKDLLKEFCWGKLRGSNSASASRVVSVNDSIGEPVLVVELYEGVFVTSATLTAGDYEELFYDIATIPLWAASALQRFRYLTDAQVEAIIEEQQSVLIKTRKLAAIRTIRRNAANLGIDLTADQLASLDRLEGDLN